MNDTEITRDFPRDSNDKPAALAVAATQPQHIGRYRIEKVLGQGGFGLVYLAHDEQLQRLVAIKVPHRNLVDRPETAEAYLTEARTVASLDHPHIVPVFDVGSTADCPCYVVSKYIDGTDLATRLKQSRLSIPEAVELAATVAEALHHAHKQGLVHRDIKPANILLDKSGKPFVGDFGLALREQDVGKGPRYAGTPAYMSPEQARGEGHRVDGRSDIFSLGVLFYELLVGRQPFRAESLEELMEQVTSFEARPPRQYDDGISKELDRICLKALSKRASERYSTAKDMADDLRHFLAEQTLSHPPPIATGLAAPSVTPASQPSSRTLASSRSGASSTTPTSDHQPIMIVPKGLRSFDAHDADFFLELLPGPRDREGLPDSLRFWKSRIEERDAEKTFSVGLICGPSGCGKSSLVKAGLLPRLSEDVIAVYVEATAEETETRLLNGLRKRCALLADNLSLPATLTALRRGQAIPAGKKVVIVLDQFEQWLHAKKEEQNAELVQALRQCDGGRVQCIVMVRDDFWMAVIRFMRELEVRLLEGENSAAVDLFDTDHARKVLAAFGRAFGKLPENPRDTTKDQKEFLTQAVSGLAQEGKVICVRLALFAEMMKSKAWTPASLKAVGGTEGVGVTFLEETFSATTAPPEHRYHQKAARADLKILLPETGSDIKGHMRSYAELLEASGYGHRPKDFEDLIRILDNEIRLITPTDPEGKETDGDSVLPTRPGQKYYQLTHDYLVHSIRDWLTRKQKETRRGRAELLLADRAAVWNARPENRLLPGWWDWLSIRLFTRKRAWTPTQRRMMSKALRACVARTGVFLLLLVLVLLPLCWYILREAAEGLVESIVASETTEVSRFVEQLEGVRYWADPKLRKCLKHFPPESKEHLRASLALLPVDDSQVEYLSSRLLDAEPKEVPVIRDALTPHKEQLLDRLWAVMQAPKKGKESQRLRAAVALAKYDPESSKWVKGSPLVVSNLVREDPVYLGQWSEALRPVKQSLLAPLADIFRDRNPERASERTLATNLLADYAEDQPQVLANLLMDADDKQFAVIYPKLKDRGEQCVGVLTGEIDKLLPSDLPFADVKREKLAKRQANAAVALLRMNQPEKVWPLLKHSSDPRVRSYLIHHFSPLGADAEAVLKRFDAEPDITIRRALLLSLGEFDDKDLPSETRTAFLPRVQEIYRTHADPGIHAAAEWLLRQWKKTGWLQQVNEKWAKEKVKGEGWWVEGKNKGSPPVTPKWYVNGQGQAMMVVPGPVEFLMGSPATEEGRSPVESQHKKRIGRTFAVAAKSVTVQEFRRFVRANALEAWFEAGGQATTLIKEYSPEEDCPIIVVDWYHAAAYCNWLSEQEGIPPEEWCYENNAQRLLHEKASAALMMLLQRHPLAAAGASSYFLLNHIPQVTGLRKDYLNLTGYRLPTEAEMEFATRAGARTSRYYGETGELLPKYAWYVKNSQERTWPVGRLKPNDLGLFDAHGNVYTWCQEKQLDYPQPHEREANDDKEDILIINSHYGRSLRGASFYNQASLLRCAYRSWSMPTSRVTHVGIRPARTLSLGSSTALPSSAEGGRK